MNYKRKKILNQKHLQYIKREGTGLEGKDPDVYGADPDGYEARMTGLHFRFIISPENQRVDLKSLTKEFVKRVELRYGVRLDWVAADHFNTGKKHTHLLENGLGLDGEKIFFRPVDVKTILREALRDICTDQVGTRSVMERRAAALRQTESPSFTMLDRAIEGMADPKGFVSFYNIVHRNDDSLLHRRIMFLKRLGLASFDVSAGDFKLKQGWKDTLKIYGSYNTFLRGRDELKAHPLNYTLHRKDSLETVEGTVVKRYFMQDNSNNHAYIIETEPGKNKYVPIDEAPMMRPGSKIWKDSLVLLPGFQPFNKITNKVFAFFIKLVSKTAYSIGLIT
jgi:hypothetical protein